MDSNTLYYMPWKVFAVLILLVALAALGVSIAAIVKKKESYDQAPLGGCLGPTQKCNPLTCTCDHPPCTTNCCGPSCKNGKCPA